MYVNASDKDLGSLPGLLACMPSTCWLKERTWQIVHPKEPSSPDHLRMSKRMQCRVCTGQYANKYWKKGEVRRFRYHNKLPTCSGCRALGYTPRSPQGYPCHWCGQTYGRQKFRRKDVVKHKRDRAKSALYCLSCLEDTAEYGGPYSLNMAVSLGRDDHVEHMA